MRIVPAAPVPARSMSVPADSRHASAAALVCAALMLSLAFLAFQIAGVLGSSFSDCSPIGDSVGGNCPIPEMRAGYPLS
jgi:hypothetical protein